MSPEAVTKAVEIVKSAIASENGSWIASPEQIAKCVDVIATKIQELYDRKN
jgi:hypothetical protein